MIIVVLFKKINKNKHNLTKDIGTTFALDHHFVTIRTNNSFQLGNKRSEGRTYFIAFELCIKSCDGDGEGRVVHIIDEFMIARDKQRESIHTKRVHEGRQ